ncbi:unnamed protein product, partial [Mesorhabditis belari]|uniref:Pre-mRNA processing factor 4 (PRP4)-like domain-containing protein n=1 Tax=Mesorhabditis belari TaxID=2138241 RepID=A0AAF3ECR4_9BILA
MEGAEAKGKVFGSLANNLAAMRKEGNAVHMEAGERMDVDSVTSEHDKTVLAEFERRKRARQLTLPTDDRQLKMKLRMLNQPICLFGEDIQDRRERLRALLSTLTPDQITKILHTEEAGGTERRDKETSTWYHRGTETLRDARVAIADHSLRKAKIRLEHLREESTKPDQEKALEKQETHRWVQQLNLHASQVADLRPVAYVEFAPDSDHIVTAGWSGVPAVWRRDTCEKVIKYQGHHGQCGCARFHPQAYIGQDENALNVASCAHDGTVSLWSLSQEHPIAQLEKHPQRVSRLAFHPTGRYLATACFDSTWRLFDVDVGEELLIQEGHSKHVSDVIFHPDGGLALTVGHDCYGRVWDLRTGKCIMFLDGHTKEIYTGEWMPNGFEMATGGADNTIKTWDLRMRRCTYTMPAHTSTISRIRIDSKGQYMISGGFDNLLKCWATRGWQPLREMKGHDTKIMCIDISPNGQWIASAAFDRTFKLWTQSDY